MRRGNVNEEHVQVFCSEICPGKESIIIECDPQYDASENECFELVEEKVKEFGGSLQLGWAIWERSGVFIEAEFHAVWKKPDGTFLDLNPRSIKFKIDSILFIPDETLKYEGKQVDNIRKALVNDKDVVRFLFLSERRFKVLNRGDRAYEYGQIILPPKELKEYEKIFKELIKLQKTIDRRYGSSNA
jgi:hypothetical protein